ncbi:MAG: hypothetical protein ACJ8C4_05915 [Gemmataceae bacterium]
MNTPHNEPWRPELLAGYVDGELNAHDRYLVETHLAKHPEARAELETQKDLSRKNEIWLKTAAPQPTDAMWVDLANKIRAGLQPQTTPAFSYQAVDTDREQTRRFNTWRKMAAGGSLVAAVAILAIGLVNRGPQAANVVNVTPNDGVLAVAAESEIEVVSLQGDGDVLVVGQPPVKGPLELVTEGEMVVLGSDRGLYSPESKDGKDPRKPILLGPSDKNPTQPVP